MKKQIIFKILVLIITHASIAQVTDTGSNVGIGVSTPSYLLEVGNNVSNNSLFKVNGSSSDVTFSGVHIGPVWSFVNSGTGTGTRFYVEDANNGASRLTFDFKGNSGATNILAGTSTGNVGIGTTTPTSLLEIAKIGATNGESIGINFTLKGAKSRIASTLMHTTNNVSNLSFFTDPDGGAELERMRITEDGNVGISTTSPEALLHIKTPDTGFVRGLKIGPVTSTTGNGAYIEFASSSADGYGAQIGGIREGSGALNALVIRTGTASQQERLRVNDAGNVGIGTANPLGKLEIKGNNGEQQQGQIHLVGNGGNSVGDAYISFAEGGEPNSKWSVGVKDNDNAFAISHGLTMDADPKFVITDVTGNIGIGTATPLGKLQINGDAGEQQQGQIHLVGNGGTGPGDAYISFAEGAEPNSQWSVGVKDNDNAFAISHGLTMDAAPKFVITDVTGNVGIGTTTPDSKLTVAGKVHAQEVKVTIGAGADFVFNNDYNLPSLASVAQFIKTNRHLPEIASEKEMQDNGLLLGEMNIKLLQKIEELTLYTLEQEEKLKTQTQTNKTLNDRLTRLEQLLLNNPETKKN